MAETVAATDRVDFSPLSSLHKLPAWLIPVLLLLGLISGYVGERVVYLNRELYYTPAPGLPPLPPEYVREQMWNMITNYSIGFGAFGAMLIGAIGLCVGLTISPTRALLGLLSGCVAGLVVGGVAGAGTYLLSEYLLPSKIEGIFKAMVIFGPLWSALGLTAGLTAALVGGRPMRLAKAIYIGIMSGCLATFAIPFIAAIVFPTSRPEVIIPDHYGARLMSYLVGAALLVVAAIRILKIRSIELASTRGTTQ